MVFLKFFKEISLLVMPLVMFLEIGLGHEKLGAMTTLYHVLFLLGWETHQIFIGSQGLSLDFDFFVK